MKFMLTFEELREKLSRDVTCNVIVYLNDGNRYFSIAVFRYVDRGDLDFGRAFMNFLCSYGKEELRYRIAKVNFEKMD